MAAGFTSRDVMNLVKSLEKQGAAVRQVSHGYRVDQAVTVPGTPRSYRNVKNVLKMLENLGYDVPFSNKHTPKKESTDMPAAPIIKSADPKRANGYYEYVKSPEPTTIGWVRGAVEYLVRHNQPIMVPSIKRLLQEYNAPITTRSSSLYTGVLYWLGYEPDESTAKRWGRGYQYEFVLNPEKDRSANDTLPFVFLPEVAELEETLQAELKERGEDDASREAELQAGDVVETDDGNKYTLIERIDGRGNHRIKGTPEQEANLKVLQDRIDIEHYDEASDTLHAVETDFGTEVFDEQDVESRIDSGDIQTVTEHDDSRDIDWALGEIERLEEQVTDLEAKWRMTLKEYDTVEAERARLAAEVQFLRSEVDGLRGQRDDYEQEADRLGREVVSLQDQVERAEQDAKDARIDSSAMNEGFWEINPNDVAGQQVATVIEQAAAYGITVRLIATRA